MRDRIQIILTLLALLTLAACNLGSSEDATDIADAATLASPTLGPPSGKPTVTIVSPQSGVSVTVNQPIILSVNATDTVGVTRVQLLAGDQIVRTTFSDNNSNWTQVFDYTPRETGMLVLKVIAFRGTTPSDPAEIVVTVNATQAQPTATTQPAVNIIPTINPYDYTCRIQVSVSALNFRSGPSLDYAIIQRLGYGDIVPIIGRLADNTWLKLRYGSVTEGWVFGELVQVYGNCNNVPVVGGPATAVPTTNSSVPTATTVVPTATTISLTAVPTTPSTPNLTITLIDGPTTVTIPTGQSSVTANYSINIKNEGGSLENQFSTVVMLLPGGAQFDLGTVGNLAANQSIGLSTTITFGTPGPVVLQFTVDSDLEITESDELDNSRLYNVTVGNE